jgi:hypothetical protein
MIQGIDYGGLYFAAMQRAAGEYLKQSGRAARRPFTIRAVWYGVRYFNTCAIDGTLEELDELYTLQDALVGFMCELSPADIVRIFPPAKVWRGPERYASTMRVVQSMGASQPLGTHGRVYALLWRYGNADIERFNDKGQQLATTCQNLHLRQ